MIEEKYINLLYNKKNYKINKYKLVKVLSILENCEIQDISDEEIKNLVKKYSLFDEVFLENINNI